MCEGANPHRREVATYVLDKSSFYFAWIHCCECVCWRMVAAAVRGTSCCLFCCLTVCVQYVCLCMWQNKRSRRWLCGHTQVPLTFDPTSKASPKNARSHLHNTREINTSTPPCCSLSLALPGLMRELLLLAEGLLLTPSRSQMIVFAAWGPDPSSPDPVTGTVDPSTGFPPRVGHKEREPDETATQTQILTVYII